MDPLIEYAIEAKGLAKTYPGVQALRGVDFSLKRGEVRALLGKNGAGKSTLVKILGGAELPDRGSIWIAGAEAKIHSPSDAIHLGVAMVHQELSLVNSLTVAENVTLGNWPVTGRFGVLLDRRKMREIAQRSLDVLGLPIDLDSPLSELTIANQQLVEIAKAVATNPRVLILDEPSSSLPDHDVDTMLDVVRRLASQGVACIYVSHRMKEIPRVADSVTVLRDGAEVATLRIDEAPTDRIAELMVGSGWALPARTPRHLGEGDLALSVRNLTREPHFRDVSFDVRAGEIVGIAGLLGSGRSELLRAIYGADTADSGTVTRPGQRLVGRASIAKMRRLGLGFVPEDRKQDGVIPMLSVSDNMSLSILARLSRAGVLDQAQQTSLVRNLITKLEIATPSQDTPLGALSGGNQQKVILSRWLAADSRVLLLDEPTRGVDVAAKAQLFRLVEDIAGQGVAVVIVSSEFDELLECTHRVLVLNGGRITESKQTESASMEWLLSATMKAS